MMYIQLFVERIMLVYVIPILKSAYRNDNLEV